MENKFFKMFNIDGIINNAQGYIDAKLQLVKLEVQEKVTKLFTLFLIIILVLFMCLMMIAFFSLALGNFLNNLFDSTYLGFLLMGFIFLALIIVLISSKNLIHKKILLLSNRIINNNDKDAL